MKRRMIAVVILIVILLAAGCRAETGQPSDPHFSTPNLQLSYKADRKSNINFSDTELAESLPCNLVYFEVTDITIPVDNSPIPLEEALRDEKITFHEIHYLAQKDAEAGICYETAESNRGLTRFSYDYISYKLIITNDIYETPDGKQHHIRDLIVTRTGCDPSIFHADLDQEDWGIEFEVANVTPSGITLNYTQSGGQLIGQLYTGDYQISRTDIVQAVFELDNAPRPETVKIQHNTASSIVLDFESRFGTLDSGDYLLYLYLHDNYDPGQMPPLVRNYHDMQCYGIEFSIP